MPSAETIQGVAEFDVVGGRKRTLRKRTRRGGQIHQHALSALVGRKRTLRKRTRRGGLSPVEIGLMQFIT